MAEMRLSAPVSGCEPNLCIFEGQNVRVLDHDGEPWFVAKDVADLLGYSNPQALFDQSREKQRLIAQTPATTAAGAEAQLQLVHAFYLERRCVDDKLLRGCLDSAIAFLGRQVSEGRGHV